MIRGVKGTSLLFIQAVKLFDLHYQNHISYRKQTNTQIQAYLTADTNSSDKKIPTRNSKRRAHTHTHTH